MTKLAQSIRTTIEQEGPITFAHYMALALYDPAGGYYVAGPERSGWDGHFITSPQLDPGFGRLWARAVAGVWRACGCPGRFDVIEVGPGEGGFARSLLDGLDAELAKVLQLHLVEQSPALRARQEDLLTGTAAIKWHASIEEVPVIAHGCLFANEVLDNLPVHVVEKHDGRWQEVFVTAEGRRFIELLAEPSGPEVVSFAERYGTSSPEGHRFEIALAAESFVGAAAARIGKGSVVFTDYGASADELARRPAGTLVCYSGAGVDADPLAAPGTKDITVHANWTSTADSLRRGGFEVTGPVPQGKVLRSLGLAGLMTDARRQREAAIAEKRGADAVRAISRSQSLAALADPSGLGSLDVMTGHKGVALPDLIA